MLAGPTCGRTLAEHGADVMLISGPHLPFHAGSSLDTGHGKMNAFVDLRDDSGAEQLRQLVKQADIFTEAYRPGSLAARGFSPEALAELRPGIIYVSLCAFGHEGPWRDRRGFDTLVQSATGIADEEGGGGPPRHMPVSQLDYATGFLAAFGAMTALARRGREGGSYLVRLSLCQTAHWLKSLCRVPGTEHARDVPNPGPADIADLIIESVSRTAAVLVVETLKGAAAGKLVYFMSIEEGRFRRPVFPGDTLHVEVGKLRRRGNVWRFRGEARVEGKLMAQATFAAMIMDD